MCGRAHLSQVLWGHRSSPETMARIYAVVTPVEWALLVPLEHFATWNKAQLAAGDDAPVWQMRVVCAWCQRPQGFKACVRARARGITHGVCPDCHDREMAALEAETGRAYLVRTEAGLQVHRSTSGEPPALADDREILPDDLSPAPVGAGNHGGNHA